MPSKYEVLASVIKREHDQLEWEGRTTGDDMPLLHILRILHNAEAHNYTLDPDEIYDQIALNYTIIDFSQPAPYALADPPTDDVRAEITQATVERFNAESAVYDDKLDIGGGDTA